MTDAMPAPHPMIVLIEPEAVLRSLIYSELKDEGYVVFPAGGLEEALEFAAVYPGSIDLTLTDATTGPSATAVVRALAVQHPGQCVRVTAITRPFGRADLLATVRRALPQPVHPSVWAPTCAPEVGDRAVFWGAGRDQIPAQ